MPARRGDPAHTVYGSTVGTRREVIPLFPLTDVLVPAMPLPLRIFEPRYRQLLADLFPDDPAPALAEGPTGPDGEPTGFGVVALRSGSEAAPPEGVADVVEVGTFAEILEVEHEVDSTVRVLAVGSRRFRVVELRPEGRPYLRAEVEWLDEPEGAIDPVAVREVQVLCDEMARVIESVAGQAATLTPLRDPTMLSYQVAAHVPLAPADRQELLAAATTADRLQLAALLLRRELCLLQRTRSIAMSPAVLRLAADPN